MYDKILVENALDMNWLKVKPENVIHERTTTKFMKLMAKQHRDAKQAMKTVEKIFKEHIDKDMKSNPIGCKFRKTYIHKPDGHYADVEVRIHRCYFGLNPNIEFNMCDECDVSSCPLGNSSI